MKKKKLWIVGFDWNAVVKWKRQKGFISALVAVIRNLSEGGTNDEYNFIKKLC